MKQRIFIYLFIFSLLVIWFQYMNSKHLIDALNTKITNSENQNKIYKDSIVSQYHEILNVSHFDLEHNELVCAQSFSILFLPKTPYVDN